MAMQVAQVINAAHESSIYGMAYNRVKKEIYTIAEGDRAIKVWDLKAGQLLRTQVVHKGMVTAIVYAGSAKLLFSCSIDGTIAAWTDKGALLQVIPAGSPLFSLAWNSRHKVLAAGGHSVLHVFKLDAGDALRLRQARQAIASAGGAGGGGGGRGAVPGAAAAASKAASDADSLQLLKRLCPPCKGWKYGRSFSPLGARSRSPAKEGAGSKLASPEDLSARTDVTPHGPVVPSTTSKRITFQPPSAEGGEEAAEAGSSGGANMNRSPSKARAAVPLPSYGKQKPEEYYGVCHTDVIRCIVITDGGKIITGGYDRCICSYDLEKLPTKPKEAFKRVRDCARAGITSMSLDAANNLLLVGSLDGALRVWSMEGRCLDRFEALSSQPISVIAVPQLNQWWSTSRFDRIAAFDPRAPANVSPYVADPNQLNQFGVELLHSPPAAGLVLAATKTRQLVAWQYNPTASHRVFHGHEDWVEALLVTHGEEDAPEDGERGVITAGAAGSVLLWELDAEQNCDVFVAREHLPLAPCTISALLYIPLQQLVAAGCEDGLIRLHYLDGRVPLAGDHPLPTQLLGHEGKVTGLVSLPGSLLLSAGEDKSLRLWDLTTMKQLQAVLRAHDTPIQCMEPCPEHQALATSCTGNKVHLWSTAAGTSVTRAGVLDHQDPRSSPSRQEGAPSSSSNPASGSASPRTGGVDPAGGAKDVAQAGPNNMTWLTRSDIEGLPASGRGSGRPGGSAAQQSVADLVAEVIRNGGQDVPEVTQVRWASFCQRWVTTADDGVLRLWTQGGQQDIAITLKGGSCKCLHVDEPNQLLLVAMMDKCVYVYNTDDPMPLARLHGHEDIVSSIGYISSCDCYITGSWDKTLRLWHHPYKHTRGEGSSSNLQEKGGGRPGLHSRGLGGGSGSKAAGGGGGEGGHGGGLLPEDSEEHAATFVSEYEKAHPLQVPRGLTQDHTSALLNAMLAAGDDDSGSSGGVMPAAAPGRGLAAAGGASYGAARAGLGRKGAGRAGGMMRDVEEAPDTSCPCPNSLTAKLAELNRRLLADLNEAAARKAETPHIPAAQASKGPGRH